MLQPVSGLASNTTQREAIGRPRPVLKASQVDGIMHWRPPLHACRCDVSPHPIRIAAPRTAAKTARRRRWIVGLAGALLLATAVALGPRGIRQADQAPVATPPLPEALAALPHHLAQRERQVPGLVPGTEKKLVFGPAGPVQAEWAVVYLHGFSASRQELAPLPEDVARALGAHFYAARLTGHGSGGAAMATGSVAAWKGDALEALAIGRRLARRVLVIGVSTGASLAAWLSLQPPAREGTAWVLVSPNFGLRDRSSEIVNAPWGAVLARAIVGPEYRFEARNADHARYWTTAYPTSALTPLMATVHLARRLPLEDWQTPVLMLISPHDQVIDVGAARHAFARIGGANKRLVEVAEAGDAMQHVLAGRILSPQNTTSVTAKVLDWVHGLPDGPLAPTQLKHSPAPGRRLPSMQ